MMHIYPCKYQLYVYTAISVADPGKGGPNEATFALFPILKVWSKMCVFFNFH